MSSSFAFIVPLLFLFLIIVKCDIKSSLQRFRLLTSTPASKIFPFIPADLNEDKAKSAESSRQKSLFRSLNKIGKVSVIEDDGYSISHKINPISRFWKKLLPQPTPGKLILVRHGETVLNNNKIFTGWIDTDLSERGVKEIEHAAFLLLERGYTVDVTYTSRLKRAIRSAWVLLMALNQIYKPVYKSWRLNERMYGSLEGRSKPGTVMELGEDAVQEFRAGLKGRPPPMDENHPHWHGNERKYCDLQPWEIPRTESLEDTMQRTIPLMTSRILRDIKDGKNVLIVAHANSLRGLVKYLDNIAEEDVPKIAIPNAIPLVYKFDKKMRPLKQDKAVYPLSGEFLEDKGLLRTALEKEKERMSKVPFSDPVKDELTVKASTAIKAPIPSYEPKMQVDPLYKLVEKERALLSLVKPDINESNTDIPPITINPELIAGLNSSSVAVASNLTKQKKKPQVIVLIRHGKTKYNKLGIFTGWEDAALIDSGRVEARNAGKLLKLHNIEFDAVYTSWLSRAIETAWLVLDELDSLWLPISKSWRLNERMYGALSGVSKNMVKELHGEKQLKIWRRGYADKPPAASSFSAVYPGNDERYISNKIDIRYSLFESLIRSISHRKLQLHRKFPKTESLKDCMARTIPYFTDVIYPRSIAQGKSVLIASSENAIRGLLMYLCDIPPDRIHEVEIPNGLPLVYNIEKRCIQLLDDGIERTNAMELLERTNFGTSPELLFEPCAEDGSNLECFLSESGRSYAYDPIIRLDLPQLKSADFLRTSGSSNSTTALVNA